MKRLLALTAAALMLCSVAASVALANRDYENGRWKDYKHGPGWGHHDGAVRCNGVFTGVTIRADVVVPRDGSCTLTDSAVKGDIEIRKNAYFQATHTSIRGEVEGDRAQTIFIDGGSYVTRDVLANQTAQVYLFDTTIGGAVGIYRTGDTVNLCGNAVKGAGVGVVRSGTDILVGDSVSAGCAGNSVTRGSVLIAQNRTDVKLVVRGNSIPRGNMYVLSNKGPSDKFVQNQNGGETLRCAGNAAPFVGSPGPGWGRAKGQCTA
jgi:hypothetical protein